MKNTIEKTILLGMAHAFTLLTPYTTEATVHITHSDFCDNATKVNYHDAFCQNDINLELSECRFNGSLALIIICASCLIATVKGCSMLNEQLSQKRSVQHPGDSGSTRRNVLWSANNQNMPLNTNENTGNEYGSVNP